jgi:hypothetical protein
MDPRQCDPARLDRHSHDGADPALGPLRREVLLRVPARRGGVPGDFGAIDVDLASDASAYHTGDTFVIDGGDAVF